ncbi:uncharacterized protein LOC130732076 [Lotus japonicus]|uniref:uncharacterized protein LOC130732076 n=1 Tax=Lotus japonicus TaxID=34305 RepID=UPI002583043B|nr:uncharacterized protein LOC130732076 [Lotus japonicus]
MDPSGSISGCSGSRSPEMFSIPIILGNFHMKLPKDFYEKKKNEIKSEVLLTDPKGCVKLEVLTGLLGGFLDYVVPTLVSFYGFKKNHDMVFQYEGGNRFKVEIYDENKNHFPYPNGGEIGKNKAPTNGGEKGKYKAPIHFPCVKPGQKGMKEKNKTPSHLPCPRPAKKRHDEPPSPEVLYLSSDTEEEFEVVVDEDVVAEEEVVADGPQVATVGQVQNARYTFEKIVTSSVAGGGHTLPLPRSYVRNFLEHSWEKVLLKKEGEQEWYICKLCWRKRNGKLTDCHLGEKFYKFVSDNQLAENDKLVFSHSGSNNVLHVRIQHH